MRAVDDRAAVCWLARRAGFGLTPEELDAAVRRGPRAEIERLLSSEQIASAVADRIWDDADLALTMKDRKEGMAAIGLWTTYMAATPTPLVDRLAWMWHGHFVSALDKVKVARLMANQIRLFRSAGLGDFTELLRAVIVDPAMLVYLDGAQSTGAEPNENFGRELLELFTVGLGTFDENDVKAGAAALSGWTVDRQTGLAVFRPRRHDDTARIYLGREGVHDVDTVVGAVVGHPQLVARIAALVGGELLGSTDEALLAELAVAFTANDLNITDLVRAALLAGVGGRAEPVVLAPVPWLAISMRLTGATPPVGALGLGLRTAGQIPMLPPNVAGWPGGVAWFGTSTVVARANLAAVVANNTPGTSTVLRAAGSNDLTELAGALGLVDPTFGDGSSSALAAAKPGVQRLALAFCTPEFVVA